TCNIRRNKTKINEITGYYDDITTVKNYHLHFSFDGMDIDGSIRSTVAHNLHKGVRVTENRYTCSEKTEQQAGATRWRKSCQKKPGQQQRGNEVPKVTAIHVVKNKPKKSEPIRTRKARDAKQKTDCRSAEAADIVFLVDESWSVGEDNFQIVKDFIRSMISSFQNTEVLGKEGIRFGVAVYGDSPSPVSCPLCRYTIMKLFKKCCWQSKLLHTKEGTQRREKALAYLADRVFNPSISREDVPKIVLLLTDGKSGDLVEEKAQRLQDRGVTIFAIGNEWRKEETLKEEVTGIKNADQRELMKIASDPVEEHVIIVIDYWSLFDILPRIARRICFIASEPPRPIKQIVESEAFSDAPPDAPVPECIAAITHDYVEVSRDHYVIISRDRYMILSHCRNAFLGPERRKERERRWKRIASACHFRHALAMCRYFVTSSVRGASEVRSSLAQIGDRR
ncbi:unnamed protein product, partial [Ranitomeya imitator]